MQNVGDRLSAVDENILNVPDGKWFDELAEIVAVSFSIHSIRIIDLFTKNILCYLIYFYGI